MRLAGRSSVGVSLILWGRSSCQISHPMPHLHKSSPASCKEYRHIWSLYACIFLISLATNSRNTCVTLYKKDTFQNIPDMVCRSAGCSDATNYTRGWCWFGILRQILPVWLWETRRTHWSEVECIRNISRETWRKEPLFRVRGRH